MRIVPYNATLLFLEYAQNMGTYIEVINLKTAVDFNEESQKCRVMQIKSEVLCRNGKYNNFSDRVNFHHLGVACMVLQK